ncbi:hypothetical protein LTR08_007354 [Meristemomyces frigidus]|nr:hypothetical protein LTR08_007354 [Meristemomyces frigidus]
MDDSMWEDKSDILFRQLKTVPREIRDLIYEFTLTEPTDIFITRGGNHNIRWAGQPIQTKPPLLSVCDQIRWEATPVCYAVNTFHAIISDNKTYKSPFIWISKLGDREAKAVGKLVMEFRLSGETKKQIEDAFHDFREAARLHATANALTLAPPFLQQLTQQVQTDLQSVIKVDIINSISAEMRAIHRAGRFDLSKISFEAVDAGPENGQVIKIWKDLLEGCLQRARYGQHIDFVCDRINVATV